METGNSSQIVISHSNMSLCLGPTSFSPGGSDACRRRRQLEAAFLSRSFNDLLMPTSQGCSSPV